MEHLFEAQRLRAQLRFVAVVTFFFATFVLRRSGQVPPYPPWQVDTLRRFGELDHVAHAHQPQAVGSDGHGSRRDDPVPCFGEEGVIHALVHDPALGGERILLPLSLDVDQRPLPAAEQEVLNARQRQPGA